MVKHHTNNHEFVDSLIELILANLGDENFGPKELAEAARISQRKLSLKLRTLKSSSVSRFICETRLRKAFEMLQKEDLTAAEVAYKVGFGSATYFNKCFHEFFGYPPGKIRKGESGNAIKLNPWKQISGFLSGKAILKVFMYALGGLSLISGLFLMVNNSFAKKHEISIAILPFKNFGDTITSQYFLDGVMEEILANLSRIHSIRVISRASVEQFRGSTRSVPEIAEELNVEYLVTGSGEKYDDAYQLRVQLLDGKNDKQLWSESYRKWIRDTKDIFGLQSQIAQSIASELKASITPEEKQLIEKIPTTSLSALDFYLRGREELSKLGIWQFDKAVVHRAEILYRKALEYDSTFAQAYTGLAEILWIKWWRDQSQLADNTHLKNYPDSMFLLSNIALSYNNQLPAAYWIRGEYYVVNGNTERALEEYDKALKYDPNYGNIYFTIGGIYEELDLVKSLENLQKSASLIHDSFLTEILTNIGRDYYKAGFPEIGKRYLLEVLKLDDDSITYSANLIRFTAETEGKYKAVCEYFEGRYLKDTTNVNVLLFLGYFNSLSGQYKQSLKYYEKYLSVCKSKGQSFPPYNRLTHIGFVYKQNGEYEMADKHFSQQIKAYSNRLESVRPGEKIYWVYPLAAVYACKGDKKRAYDNLNIFNRAKSFTLEWVTLLKNDPQFNSIRYEPEFQQIVRDVEAKYLAEHERVSKWLKENGGL
jgi:TolB-like protein/AraC-like DNA-binding protein/Tfp pilus assembly protein PilF